MNEDYTWLQNLKEGDKVIVHVSQPGICYHDISRVKRVTPKQLILGTGEVETAYWKKDGEMVGGRSYYHRKLYQFVDNSDLVKTIRAEKAKKRTTKAIEDFLKSKPTVEQLIAVADKVLEVTKSE